MRMAYHVRFTKKSLKQLKNFDKSVLAMLKLWITNNLENSDNPRAKGKALVGDMKGYWRYRVGEYRIIADIVDDELVIILVSVAHRREVYDH